MPDQPARSSSVSAAAADRPRSRARRGSRSRVSSGFSSPRAKTSTDTYGAPAPPGLTVTKLYLPSASVPHRPQPKPAGARRARRAARSPPSRRAPARPRRRARGRRSGAPPAARDRPAGAARAMQRPNEKNGPTVCDGVAPARHHPPPASRRGRRARCRTGTPAPTPESSCPSRGRDQPLARRGSRTDWKIGSAANSGSPGKYICVTRRSVNARPKIEKWMWAGRHALGWFATGRRRA